MPNPNPTATKVTPSSLGVDRRVWVRYTCDLESTCHENRAWIRFSCEGERPAHATLLINPSHKIEARVLNISPGGVGLATHRHCEPGTPLKIELIDASGRTSRPMQIRVVHSTAQGKED